MTFSKIHKYGIDMIYKHKGGHPQISMNVVYIGLAPLGQYPQIGTVVPGTLIFFKIVEIIKNMPFFSMKYVLVCDRS